MMWSWRPTICLLHTVHFCFLWKYCARISCLILQVSPNQTGFPQRNSPFPTAPVTSNTYRSPKHRPKSAQPPFEFQTTAVPNQQQSRAVVLVNFRERESSCQSSLLPSDKRNSLKVTLPNTKCLLLLLPYIDREILCSPSLKAHITRLSVCFYLL